MRGRIRRPSRHPRRGVSLAELMVAMGGVSVVIASTGMLVHGAMRAQSESRRFFDDERASVRLARRFRADVHASRSVGPAGAGEGTVVSLGLPGGGVVEYRLAPGGTRLERRARDADGAVGGPREDYAFSGPCAAMVAVDGDRVRLEIVPGDGTGKPAAAGSRPTSSAEARRKPISLAVTARLASDLRFSAAPTGEVSP